MKCIFYSPPNFFRVQDVFRYFNIPIDYFSNPNSDICIKRLEHLDVDIIFNAQPKILKRRILNVPKITCLNEHTSKLPEYRGVEPVFHALLNNCKTIGVSIHKMTEEIDSGEVYAQAVVPSSKSVFDCYHRTFALGSKLFTEAISNLEKKRLHKK